MIMMNLLIMNKLTLIFINLNFNIMKINWKKIIQVAIAILSALAGALTESTTHFLNM